MRKGTHPLKMSYFRLIFWEAIWNRDLDQRHTAPCLTRICVIGPTLPDGNWYTETDISSGLCEATSWGRTWVLFGRWNKCTSCIGRKHWAKGRCVRNNWLGFCVWLSKLSAGQEERICVRINKWLFHAKLQAVIQPSFHSSSTLLPKHSD